MDGRGLSVPVCPYHCDRDLQLQWGTKLICLHSVVDALVPAAIDDQSVLNALRVSVQTAVGNAILAITLGVPAGISSGPSQGSMDRTYLALIFVVLGIPELVSAIGQMIWLDRLGLFHGIARLSIGHSLFNLAVVPLSFGLEQKEFPKRSNRPQPIWEHLLGAPFWTLHFPSCPRRYWPDFCYPSHCPSTTS